VRIARGFAECRGLTAEQLEDIYQETALALLSRPYGTEDHLRNALRHGIKHRALNMHRDHRRRSQILRASAPSMQRVAESRASVAGPEEAALAEQDRLIVREFLTELDELEQRVFWLIADGMRYRAIASAVQIPVNEARNASRSCERKRQRFQLLYDTGRLCGYRAATIQALQGGELTDAELAQRAFAHLDACASCRVEHKTNAKLLGRSFGDQLAALLPLPALLGPFSSLHRPWPRAGAHLGGGMRERLAALIGAGSAGAKLTASVATVAVIAGGTIGATQALQHHPTAARRHITARPLALSMGSLVPKPVLSHRENAVRTAAYHRRTPRSHIPVYTALTPAQPVTGRQGAAAQVAAREFGLESAPSVAASTHHATGHSAANSEKAAEREFGTPLHRIR